LRQKPKNLSGQQKERLEDLDLKHLATGQACLIRLELRENCQQSVKPGRLRHRLESWLGWVRGQVRTLRRGAGPSGHGRRPDREASGASWPIRTAAGSTPASQRASTAYSAPQNSEHATIGAGITYSPCSTLSPESPPYRPYPATGNSDQPNRLTGSSR
jgi:hypothetical protein